MIVRDEAHIVGEVIDAAAPYIDYWVVVDTGSQDGTQDFIRGRMAELGIPGELLERPWRDFGHNRSEALTLSQGKAEYIWMMDADDTVVGTPDFRGLTADCYAMLIHWRSVRLWRRQLFRDGVPWYYRGVVHEIAVCDEPFTEQRLEGDHYIQGRTMGARTKDPRKFLRDAEVLLAHVEEHPDDEKSVFYLAQSYFDAADFENALTWYARRVELGGWAEEVFYSLLRVASCLAELETPWGQVEDAYARAWAYRPTRAEPLYEVARRLRMSERYELGYLYARWAAAMPVPAGDTLRADNDIYTWHAMDEQAVCASWIGRETETFELCRRLLAVPGVDEAERSRFAANRDLGVPRLLDETAAYPHDLAQRPHGRREAEVTVSLVASRDRESVVRTLNSFLRCCTDVDEVGRFLVLDTGLAVADRAELSDCYPFVEFLDGNAAMTSAQQIDRIGAAIGGRYWLHVGQGWQFFAADPLITRLRSVPRAEPGIFQVGINVGDAATLTGLAAPAATTLTAPGAGRYVLTGTASQGPHMVDVERLGARSGGTHVGWATLDEVLCVKVG